MIRIGLVGAGKIVDTFHLPAWKKLKEVEVVSICDPRREIASELAQRFCIPNVFSNIE
jgi:predicted dehydrogenase